MTVDYDAAITTSNLLPVDFPTSPLNPTSFGLYAAIGTWQPDPLRRFLNGVRIRGANYGGENSFGVWQGGWCGRVITIANDGTGGTLKITVDGAQTAGVAFGASADDVKTALLALATLDVGDVGVTSDSPGSWVLHFPTRHVVDVDGSALTGGTITEFSDETKFGERPDILDPFAPITVWAYDECDLTEASREEIIERSQQVLALEEQVGVEREFAARLMLDAQDLPGSIQTATDIALAVGYLEAQMAMTGTTGYFHVGAQWPAAATVFNNLFVKQGTRWVSPLGNIWVIGGGYVDGLDDYIIATSQPFGWRDDTTTTTAIDTVHKDVFAAVTERSVAIGYESLIAAVQITA